MPFRRLLALSALVTLAATSSSFAQTLPTTTPTASLAQEDFLIRIKKGNTYLSDTDAKYFFNRARCQCEAPITVRVDLSTVGTQKRSLITKGTLNVLVGPSACVTGNANTQARCLVLASMNLTDILAGFEIPTTVGAFFSADPSHTAGSCDFELDQTIWLAIDSEPNTIPDLVEGSAPQLAIRLDGLAPAPPDADSVKVAGGNEALNVSWSRTTGVADQNGYLVFCARGGTLPPFQNPPYYSGREFYSASSLCPDVSIGSGAGGDTGTGGDAGGGGVDGSAGSGGTSGSGGSGHSALFESAAGDADGGVAGSSGTDRNEQTNGVIVAPPDGFFDPNPAFLCSELLTTTSDWRIKGLQNGVPYVVGVASVDTHGNASTIQSAVLQTPVPTEDFYRGYRERGGQAQGGFCTYGPRPRSLGLFGIAAVGSAALAVARAGRRRRR